MGALIISVGIIGLAIIGALFAIGLTIAAIIGEPINQCECGCEHE